MSGTPVVKVKPQLEHEKVKLVLIEFYQIYNTARLSSLDHILISYLGKEVELLEELKKRYNVDFEPFNILLHEYRAATGEVSTTTAIEVSDKLIADASTERPGDRSTASVTSPAPAAASQRPKLEARNSISLGLSNIPSLDKLMSGWKGFVLEGVTDARKEEDSTTAAEVNEAMTKLFEQLIATPGLSVEMLQQLQESIEINARLEKQLKNTLRKMDVSSSSSQKLPISLPAAIISTKPRRGSSNTDTISSNIPASISQNQNSNTLSSPPQGPASDTLDYYGIEALSSFDGRTAESLSFEILGLRDIVGGMRDFILQSLLAKEKVKDKPKEEPVVVNNEIEQSVTLAPIPSSAAAFVVDTDKVRMKEFCERLNIDWLDLERLRRDLTDMSTELQLCKASLTSQDNIVAQKNEEIADLQSQLLQSELSIVELRRARGDLIQICERKIKTMEGKYREYIREMQENMQFEQEEAMSKLSSVAEIQQQWQASISNEAQTEIIRLRVELAKSRRQESQREREVSYLQRQLMEASKQLAQFVVDSETADRGIAD